jgi:hypothetical protein
MTMDRRSEHRTLDRARTADAREATKTGKIEGSARWNDC